MESSDLTLASDSDRCSLPLLRLTWRLGIAFLLSACVALFVGVQLMFEVREQELRQGIRMKC